MPDASPQSRDPIDQGRPAVKPPQASPRRIRLLLNSKRALWVGLGLALILVGLILRIGNHEAGRRVRYVPVTREIASGRVLINPRDGVEYRVEITPDMHNAQIIGNFTAYGGPTNTVSAVIMKDADYAVWINGNDSFAYYSSGQKATDQFAVRLDPGKYAFGISNRLSKSATKFVYLDLQLIYYRREMY